VQLYQTRSVHPSTVQKSLENKSYILRYSTFEQHEANYDYLFCAVQICKYYVLHILINNSIFQNLFSKALEI